MISSFWRTLTKFLAVVFLGIIAFLLVGCGGEPEVTALPTPTLSAELQAGFEVYTQHCAICHAITPETVIRGPSFHGMAVTAGTRVEGQDAKTYLYNSIMRPDDFLVDGFENIMPSTLSKTLTGEEIDAVVAYLLTFE